MKHYFGNSYIRTVLIHTYSRAIIFRGTLYGSTNSSHANSSLICVTDDCNDGIARPAFVTRYLSVDVLLQQSSLPQPIVAKVFLARINWLVDHDKKGFYGSNVEVWQKFLPSVQPNTFVPVVSIKCRCAYVDHVVKFNLLHEEQVTIVVHFCAI